MRSPVMIAIVYMILLLLGVYLYRYILRMVDLTKLSRKSKVVRIIVALICVAMLIAATRFMGYGLVLLAHVLVIAWISDGIHFIIKKVYKPFREESYLNKLYKSGLIPIVITTIILSFGYFNMRNVRETDYQVYTKKNIRTEGYTIAMISDLHFPTTMDAETLASYCEEINSKNPDFVVLCGDIVDERTSREEMQEAISILSKIQNEFGIFYVYGNHDSARYSTTPKFTTGDLNKTLVANNIKVLNDNSSTVNGEITMIGRADRGYGKDDTRIEMKSLLKEVDTSDFLLVLDHQPKELKENAELGIDLQLSGHTHAGQLWPAGIIGEWLGANEQNYGLLENSNFISIVSSGIAGWGNSFRTAKHSEYVIIELKPEK